MFSPSSCEVRNGHVTRTWYLIQEITFSILPIASDMIFTSQRLVEEMRPDVCVYLFIYFLQWWCERGPGQGCDAAKRFKHRKRPGIVCAGARLEKAPKKGNARALSTEGDGVNPMLTAEAESRSGPCGQTNFYLERFIRKWKKKLFVLFWFSPVPWDTSATTD